LAEFIKKQKKGIYLQWAKTEDLSIIGIVSKDDDFGYFINVEAPDLFEWGYTAPTEELNARIADMK